LEDVAVLNSNVHPHTNESYCIYYCISNIDNTRHEEETSNNRHKTKSSTAYSSITTRLMD
jgi:hypothetical protein